MLNYIWVGMMVVGFSFGIVSGKGDFMVTALINGSLEAVTLAFSICGIIGFWCGIMKIAQNCGIIETIAKNLNPVITFLFPSIPKNSKAREHIATNFAANFLGLGWAATPAGLLAMKEMQKINKHKEYASNDMCTFMIVNMSSVQLISINIIALRAKYGSLNPSEIIVPAILATCISTFFGILVCKYYNWRSKI